MKQRDYLIIGAGLAGSSLALELRHRGLDVLLLDDGRPAASSRVAAGLINPVVPKGIRKTWMADTLFPLIPSWYRHWEAVLGATFFQPLELVQLHSDVRSANEWTNRCGQSGFEPYLKHGSGDLPAEIQAPFGYSVILQAGRLNTNTFLSAAADWLAAGDNYSRQNFELSELRQYDGQWQYDESVFRGVIFCEGIRVLDNPWFNWLPFHPTGGDILTVQIAGMDGKTSARIYKRRHWIVPDGQGHWLLGSNFHKGDRSEETQAADAQQLCAEAGKWLQAPIQILAHQRGVRPTVEGRRPYLGAHPEKSGIYIFNGLGSKGSSLIPWLAPMMAGWLCGQNTLWPEVDIARFSPGNEA